MTKEELKVYMKDRHQRLKNDPEYRKLRALHQKKYRIANPEFYRALEFAREMKKYSTTVEWYRDKLIEQRGLCALCDHLNHSQRGGLHRLQVDHNHLCCDLKTKSCGKCLRGLICEKCNLKLSTVEEILKEGSISPLLETWLHRAMRYLAQYSTQELTQK